MTRPTLQDSGGLPALNISAVGQDKYGSVDFPFPGRGVGFNLLDLAPLSETLGDIGKEIDAAKIRDAENAYLRDQKDYQANPEAFRERVAKGEIPEYANPVAREWFFGRDAGRRMEEFQDEMLGQIPGLANAVGQNGSLAAPGNFNEAFANTWEKYSSSYAFKTGSGKAVALSELPKIQAALYQRFVTHRLQAENELKKFQLVESGTKTLSSFAQALAQGSPQSADYQAQWDALFKDARQFGVLGVRDLQIKAMEAFFQNADPATAIQALGKLQELNLGNTTFANDTKGRELLQNAALSSAERSLKIQEMEAQQYKLNQQKATQAFSAKWFPQFLRVQGNPQAYYAQRTAAMKEIQSLPAELQKPASDWLDAVEISFQAREGRESNDLFESLMDEIEKGNPVEAIRKKRFDQASVLTWKQQEDLDKAIETRIVNSDIYDSHSYKGVEDKLQQTVNSAFPGRSSNALMGKDQLNDQLAPLRKDFEKRLRIKMEEAKSSPTRRTDILQWIETNTAQLQSKAEALSSEAARKSNEVISEIEQGLLRKKNVSTLLESQDAQRWVAPDRLRVYLDRTERESDPDQDITNTSALMEQLRKRIQLVKAKGIESATNFVVVGDEEVQKAYAYFKTNYRVTATQIREDDKKYPTTVIRSSLSSAREQGVREAARYAAGEIPWGDQGLNMNQSTGGAESKPASAPAGSSGAESKPAKQGKAASAEASGDDAAIKYQRDLYYNDPSLVSYAKAIPVPVENGKLAAPIEFFRDYKEFLVGKVPRENDITDEGNVFKEFFLDFMSFSSGNGPGSIPVARESAWKMRKPEDAMDASLRYYSKQVLDSKLNDADKTNAILHMYQWYGMKPEFVENGEIVVEDHERLRGALRDQLLAQYGNGAPARGESDFTAALVSNAPADALYLLKRLRSYRVPISGSEFDPWQTDFGFTAGQLDSYRKGSKGAAFLKKIGVPPEKADDFWDLQYWAAYRNKRVKQ